MVDPLTLSCGSCGAKPQEPCTRDSNTMRHGVHASRYAKAERRNSRTTLQERRLQQFITRARLQCKAVRDGGIDLGDPFAKHIGGLCMELLDILREPTAEARRQRLNATDTAGWEVDE